MLLRICYWTDAWHYEIYLFYIIKKQTTTDKAFCLKIVRQNSKAGLCLHVLWWTWKKKKHLMQSHWLLCILKNCDWSRKFMPLSNLTLNSLLVEWNLKAKVDLNWKIYKIMKISSQFLLSEQGPVSQKAWKYELKKYAWKTSSCS